MERPEKGDIVKVIVKPYDEGVKVNGIVQRVLTKKKVHTRGHKYDFIISKFSFFFDF